MQSSSKDTAQRPRPVTWQWLIRIALTQLDGNALASAVGVPLEQLEQWSRATEPVAFEARLAIVFAVIALAPPDSSLFRAAATFRSRLQAEREFRQGSTEAKTEPPIRWFGV